MNINLSLLLILSLAGCNQSKSSKNDSGDREKLAKPEASQDLPNDDSESESEVDESSDVNEGSEASWWKPTSEKPLPFHWQLSEDFVIARDAVPAAVIYDLDGEQTSAETVAKLHALDPEIKVICYFDAGVNETYRSDADRFPDAIIGKEDIGWDGSFWLDVRQLEILKPILETRIVEWCKKKGFDAIEPDETEVWSNDSGFPITKQENHEFHRMIADLAHKHGLSVGLKGNNSEAQELAPYFDWALSEQCAEYDECQHFYESGGQGKSFIEQSKAVFTVEYDAEPDCDESKAHHLNSMKRDLNLMGPQHKDYLAKPCVPFTVDSW